MADNFDMIAEALREFQPLFDRMDADRDLYYQLPFVMRDVKTNKPAKDVINVTMNDAVTFADRVQSFLNDAGMHVVIKGNNLQPEAIKIIESFDNDLRYEIDQALMWKSVTSLYSFLVEQACVRGVVAARYLCWDDNGLFKPDLVPCDSRYLVYEYGKDDLDWAAFRSVRSESAIKTQYPKAEFSKEGTKWGIWEYWDKDSCEIYLTDPKGTTLEKQLLKKIDNAFGVVPFVIQGVGAGSMLQDEDSISYRNESLFAHNRLLYGQVNLLATILQTLNYDTFNRTYQWESESGTMALESPAPGTRETIPVDKGTKGLFPIEIADVNNSTRLFYAFLLGAIQRGSLPNLDYGNLTFPLSAVAIHKLTQTKDAIFAPRLQAISWFYRKLHYMMRNQYIKGGYEAELGEEGLSRTYTASELDKKYTIKYEFHSVIPEQDIANQAVAQQALANGLPQEYVYENILKVQDPKGLIMQKKAEIAGQLDPVIELIDYGHALIKSKSDSDYFKSFFIRDTIERIIRQRYSPQGAEKEPTQTEVSRNTGRSQSGQSMIPLMAGGGGGGGSVNEFEQAAIAPEETLQREERRSETIKKSEEQG